MSPDDPRHGTNAGYIAHRRANEEACGPCLAGRARFERYRRYDTELGRPRKLPAIGARRRIRSLQRLGWSLKAIANEAGWNSGEALQYVMRSERVSRASWWRIAEVYDRLSMRIPPYTSGSVRARNYAARMGYPPPLAWDNIDNPRERPNFGTVSSNDERRRELVDEWHWLMRQGESQETAAARLGLSVSSLKQYRSSTRDGAA